MDLHFVSAVVGLASAKKTGTLLAHLRTSRGDALTPPPGRLHVRIHFEDGWPVFAEEGATAEALGRLLVREGTLSEAQYALVLEKVALGSRNGRPVRFGEAAIAMGLLTLAQRDAALSSQVRSKVTRCLGWDRVEHTFQPSPLPPSLDRHPTPLEPLVLGALRTAARAEIDRLLGLPELGYPTLVGAPREIARVFRLRTPEVNFVRLADGTRATSELLRADVPDSVHAGPLLAALALTGRLEILRAPASSPAASAPGDADEVPVSRASAHDDPPPRQARAPALTAAPSRSLPRSLAAWGRAARERARAALARHRRTRDSLAEAEPPPSIRAPGSDAEARILAERAFIGGRRALLDGDVAGARELFERAVGLCPDACEYRLYVAWLAHHGAPAAAGDGALAEAAAAALAESGETALGHYVLGAIALRQGELARARASFDLAYTFEPRAARYFRLVTLRASRPRRPLRSPPRSPRVAQPGGVGAPQHGAPRPLAAPQHGGAPAALGAPPPAPSSSRAVCISADPVVVIGTYEAPPSSRDVVAPLAPPAPVVDVAAPFAPPPASAPAGQGGALEPPSSPRTRSRAPWIALALLFASLAAGAGGATLWWRASAPALAPLETTSALAPRASPPVAPASLSAGAHAAPVDPPAASPRGSPSPPPSARAAGSDTCRLELPPSSAGRRVYVDGRVVGEGPADLVVPCGARTVQIGSKGTARPMVLPCGGVVRAE